MRKRDVVYCAKSSARYSDPATGPPCGSLLDCPPPIRFRSGGHLSERRRRIESRSNVRPTSRASGPDEPQSCTTDRRGTCLKWRVLTVNTEKPSPPPARVARFQAGLTQWPDVRPGRQQSLRRQQLSFRRRCRRGRNISDCRVDRRHLSSPRILRQSGHRVRRIRSRSGCTAARGCMNKRDRRPPDRTRFVWSCGLCRIEFYDREFW